MSRRDEPKPKIRVRRHAEEEHESHSGQWKVAYADFVTAMMAFFMILWIVTTTTETQRAGIAKFFDSTAMLDLHSGNNVLDGGGSLVPSKSSPAASRTSRRHRSGADGRQADLAGNRGPLAAVLRADDRTEAQRLAAVKAETERLMASGDLKDVAGHLTVTLTPEGLRLQIFDRDAEPMFASGDSEPTPRLKRILGVIAPILQSVPNLIAITGHTDSAALNRPNYSNWELSADRANAARRQFEADGIQPVHFFKVEGMGSTDPLFAQAPDDPRNRRIAITVLRDQSVREMRQGRADPTEAPRK